MKRRDEEGEDGEGADEEGETVEDEKDQVKRRFSIRSLGEMFSRKFTSPVKRQWPWNRPENSNNGPSAAPSTPMGTILPGYLTGLQLSESPSGGNGAGYPLGIILQVSTSTSGGKSSAISAAPWSNEHVTLADSEMGLVQVWRFEAVPEYPKSPPRTSGSKTQPPPNNFGPDPPIAPDPPLQPDPSLDNGRPTLNPQSQQQPKNQPSQPQWQPAPATFPQSQSQQPVPSTSNSPKSSAPSNPLDNGGNLNLVGNQNLAHNTTPKGLQPANPLQQVEQLPAFSITGRSIEKRQVMKNIRASIVSEWKAPSWAIGTGDPAAPRGENRQNDNKKGKALGWGRGCCAHALWYD